MFDFSICDKETREVLTRSKLLHKDFHLTEIICNPVNDSFSFYYGGIWGFAVESLRNFKVFVYNGENVSSPYIIIFSSKELYKICLADIINVNKNCQVVECAGFMPSTIFCLDGRFKLLLAQSCKLDVKANKLRSLIGETGVLKAVNNGVVEGCSYCLIDILAPDKYPIDYLIGDIKAEGFNDTQFLYNKALTFFGLSKAKVFSEFLHYQPETRKVDSKDEVLRGIDLNSCRSIPVSSIGFRRIAYTKNQKVRGILKSG